MSVTLTYQHNFILSFPCTKITFFYLSKDPSILYLTIYSYLYPNGFFGLSNSTIPHILFFSLHYNPHDLPPILIIKCLNKLLLSGYVVEMRKYLWDQDADCIYLQPSLIEIVKLRLNFYIWSTSKNIVFPRALILTLHCKGVNGGSSSPQLANVL